MATDDVSSGDKHIVCQYKDNISSFGFWIRHNTLNYALPLILLQLSAISVVSILIEICLRPLGQSSIVAQILGGILFGPSVLGHQRLMGSELFPARSIMTLETAASFGIMFFLFAIGVRTDTTMILRPGREPLVIGISVMIITLFFSVSLAFALKACVKMDDSLARALPFIGISQCLTPFSNVSCLLIELKLASSDLGRLACSTAILCDIMGMIILMLLFAILQSSYDLMKSILSIGSAVMFVFFMVFITGPLVRKTVKRIPTGKPLGDQYVFLCFAGVLLTGFITELLGQHFMFGPIVLGLIVPDGPPFGAPIISKLDLPVGKFFYPTFLTTSGIKTNIFTIDLQSLWITSLLIFSACIIKIGAVMFASRFLNIDFHDSIIIGLILNARGVCELLMYNLWRDGGILSDQEFALTVISVVGVTAIVTPLIKLLYDPMKRHVPLKRRTIQHSKREAELRILVCIHNADNVPSIINVLEASHATEVSPIAVIAVLLEELVGRATHMLVAHQSTRTLQPNNSRSGHIINALRQYELCNESCVTIQSFSAISHFEMVQDDIYRVALDQNANIVILPFHKHWEIDGSIGSVNRNVQGMNIKVMEKAPCSVGILVDRGILTGSMSILNNQSIFHVAVIYIGGPDDAESLCYGSRMGAHSNVTLSIIRFLLYGSDSARERMKDNNLIDEVRQANMENQNFKFQEQVVKDGVGLAASLRSLENSFDLLIVGRNHQASEILMGLGAWSECPELGVVGDILSSPDFGSTASVLVVQQQRLNGDKLMNRMMKPVVISHEAGHESRPADDQPAIIEHEARWDLP
ncbi:hypothetical protein ABFS82_06G061200 [Erythranthe guttata]|nr:PREDICTED: cation/H(+) antiporter 15-like [Erythranthe guttata]|eukprot:XP_012858132.1 PREDICTED: cation/H(+) antiporter 15-like [Erythranthe guttata]